MSVMEILAQLLQSNVHVARDGLSHVVLTVYRQMSVQMHS